MKTFGISIYQIAEFLRQEEMGNIVLEDGASDYTYSEGFEWLNTFYVNSRDIESCTENEE